MSKESAPIVILGFGWVGQANALALLLMGHEVYFYDPAVSINRHYPVYENQYDKVKRLDNPLKLDSASTSYIVCVGDRVDEAGNQDISYIKKATQSLEKGEGTVILRSTIRPDYLKQLHFDIYLPEFLHEKTAVEECLNPQYFVVGKRDSNFDLPGFFYDWRKRSFKEIECTPEEASHIKYLSNVWNALRIAFTNEFGRSIHAQASGDNDREAMESAHKVLYFLFGDKPYFRYGRAYGGHCLPKDMRAYAAFSAGHINPKFLEGVEASNKEQEIFQQKHHELQEWFSPWRKVDISGTEALKALGRIIRRKFRNLVSP